MTCTVAIENVAVRNVDNGIAAIVDHYNYSQCLYCYNDKSSKSKPSCLYCKNNISGVKGSYNHESFLNELKLRRLTSDDIEKLKSLCNEWFPIDYPDSWYQSITTNCKFDTLAATYNDEIVAIIVSERKSQSLVNKEDSDMLSPEFSSEAKVVYILSLGVDKKFRRKGVASFMIKTLIKNNVMANQNDNDTAKAIYLHVLSSNKTAIKFYEKHGFKMLHFLRYYYVINQNRSHGFSYILYINDGRPPLTWLQYLKNSLCGIKHVCRVSKLIMCKIGCFCMHAISLNYSKPILNKNAQYRSL